MMNPIKRRNLVLTALATGLLLAGWWLLSPRTHYNWRFTLDPDSNEPYGLSLFVRLLQDRTKGVNWREMSPGAAEPLPNTDEQATLLLVGPAALYDSSALQEILSFTEAGNQVFLSVRSLPFDLMDRLIGDSCSRAGWTDLSLMAVAPPARLRLYRSGFGGKEGFPLTYYRNGTPSTDQQWTFFDFDPACPAAWKETLGSIGGQDNFIRIPYGKGQVYLHSTPLAFTNVHFREPAIRRYIEYLLAYLPDGPVYWDDIHQVNETVSRERNQMAKFGERPSGNGVFLRFLLEQPSLRTAWILLLFLSMLFLVFRSKRMQRIIPEMEKPENTSLAFIRTMGRLHERNGTPRQLALYQIDFWKSYIRDNHYLSADLPPDALAEKLSGRTGLPKKVIVQTLQLHRTISKSATLSNGQLRELNQLHARFYQRKGEK